MHCCYSVYILKTLLVDDARARMFVFVFARAACTRATALMRAVGFCIWCVPVVVGCCLRVRVVTRRSLFLCVVICAVSIVVVVQACSLCVGILF